MMRFHPGLVALMGLAATAEAAAEDARARRYGVDIRDTPPPRRLTPEELAEQERARIAYLEELDRKEREEQDRKAREQHEKKLASVAKYAAAEGKRERRRQKRLARAERG